MADAVQFVFAAWVDKDFPVQDIMAEDAENYEKYSKWLMPSMILFAAGTLIFLICLIVLTAGAGRNNEEETVQLNFFDRWCTEIGACAVAVLWGVPFALILGLGVNVADSLDKLKYIVLFVAALGAWTAVWIFIGWLSLVRRIKAKTLWKNSLLRKIWKLTVKVCRKLWKMCRNSINFFAIGWLSLVRRIKAKTLWKNSLLRKIWKLTVKVCRKLWKMCRNSINFFAENTVSRVKTALIFTAFCFLQFLLCAFIFSGLAEMLFLSFLFPSVPALRLYFLGTGGDALSAGGAGSSGSDLLSQKSQRA